MKKIILTFLAVVMLASCSSGNQISDTDFKARAENSDKKIESSTFVLDELPHQIEDELAAHPTYKEELAAADLKALEDNARRAEQAEQAREEARARGELVD